MKRNAVRDVYLSFVASLLISLSGSAMAIDPVYTSYFNDSAISGYDAVAYFTQAKPVTGSDEFTFDYKYATWKFSSQKHLDLFKADPTAYAPSMVATVLMLWQTEILPAPSQIYGPSIRENCI